MLVNLNFITSPDWALRGVSLNFKETMFDYIGECTLVNATFDPNHPFWAEIHDPTVNNNTSVMTIVQTKHAGILAGYRPGHAIEHFTDYDVVDEYPMIHEDGSLYTSEDFRAIFNSTDDILPSGRPRPESYLMHPSYGVADTLEQIMNKYKNLIEGPEEIVLCYHPVLKSEQPKDGGWRWHKNGEYIGTKRSKERFEYLYDEPDVDVVLCYNFIKVKKKCI
ncbi:hypothetical protein G17_00128 [Escherichia phage vB_EcoM_G17]|uniref:Uncharacterized protein n=1 Tax=Escherichia phage 121Q TaxID=1555202 RepID=A0A097EXD6_9CAUD|nr:hypothetical protein [Escherichia coli]YP_009101772.1 hypothetical protein PBI_121Q_185 [Escherichia phage 121Q]MED6573074.1 hypothetical protein [Escherichia coli O157]QBO61624.1 hypothetical protein G17_00128 [Escherichia phage vB_EcoM_G17]WNN14452.1 hypothetical protein Sharanji_gp164 [Escherichia phage Sharanji]AIT14075.1 hypothetical protein PBI_121Q_185 [Escherichia phage 121Q]EFJ0711417.1 hypothetical protein [Escherichia coli]